MPTVAMYLLAWILCTLGSIGLFRLLKSTGRAAFMATLIYAVLIAGLLWLISMGFELPVREPPAPFR